MPKHQENQTNPSIGTVIVTREGAKMRGRRPRAKAPTKYERVLALRENIVQLPVALRQDGFEKFLPPVGPIAPLSEPEFDPITEGYLVHAKDPLGVYLQRVSIVGNLSQRPPFDHVQEPVYRRLIRDFLDGAVMPEAKLAAMSNQWDRVASLDKTGIRYSVVDGLQRLHCYGIAVLVVWHGPDLVKEGCLPQRAWEVFEPAVARAIERVGGDRRRAIEELLKRQIRFEVAYNITLQGLLHYMVIGNTAQKRMSLPVQLEIMQQPLLEQLRKSNVKIWNEVQKTPGLTRPKEQFAAADLLLATQAFLSGDPQVSAEATAEKLLDEDDELEHIDQITSWVEVLRRIVTDLNPRIMQAYEEPHQKFILSGGGVFFIALAAACGSFRAHTNEKQFDGAMDRLRDLLTRGMEDPLNLKDYAKAIENISSARGRSTRQLVCDTFIRFFNGTTTDLEWWATGRFLGVFGKDRDSEE